MRERVGVPLLLVLVWLWFEFGRPSNPMGIPMVLSIGMFVGWLFRKDKRWSGQHSWFVALLALLVISVPLATNNYSAYVATYGMAVTLLCVCIPMPSLITSSRKARAWIYTFVAVAVYVGTWALFHGGYGPAGSGGAQDENYVAAMMCMALPFAYFSLFGETRRPVRLLLMSAIVIFTGAIIVSLSRGGFVGFCAVVLYCLVRSPRKLAGFSAAAVIALAVVLFAGSGYWEEMATITDTSEATADIRLEIWQIGLRMWRAHPVFGVGPGNFRWELGTFQTEDQLEKFGHNLSGTIVAHSLHVELLAELGTAGVIIVSSLVLGTWRNLRGVRRASAGSRGATGSNVQLRCYADAVLCSMLACLVTGVFLSLLYFSYLWLFVALGSAIAQVFNAQTEAQRHPSRGASPPAGSPRIESA